MITIVASAHCLRLRLRLRLRCDWTAGPGDWAAVDGAAEAHTSKAGHPTATVAAPATTTTGAKQP